MKNNYLNTQKWWSNSKTFLVIGLLLTNCAWSQQAKQKTNYKAIKAQPISSINVSTGNTSEAFLGKEDLSKRTKNAKHYQNQDGSFTAKIGGNYHYLDANGKWQDINLNIENTANGFQNVTNEVKSHFPKNASSTGVAMQLESGTTFTWWKNPSLKFVGNSGLATTLKPASVNGYTNKEKLTYANLYNGVSEEFVIRNNGMESNTILHQLTAEMNAASSMEFSHIIPLNNSWKVKDAAGKVRVTDFQTSNFSIDFGNNQDKMYFGEIVVFDNTISKENALLIQAPADKLSSQQRQQLAQSVTKLNYTIRFVEEGIEIITALPVSWLKTSGRNFPVTIDPTVTITPTSSTGNFYGPLSHWYGYQRHANLYLQSEIGIYGTITDIEYNSTTGGTAGSTPTKVYMQQTANTTLSVDTWDAPSYTGGAQLCLDQNTDQGNTTGWKMLSLTTPFVYSQDNLLIMVNDSWGGSGSVKYYNMSSTATNRQAYKRQDNSDPGDGTDLQIGNYLSEIRITYIPSTNCVGVPATTTAVSSSATVCPNQAFTVNLTGIIVEGGLEVQWESSIDGGSTWNNFGNPQTGISMNISAGQSTETQYRATTTCVPSGTSVTSSVVTVTMAPTLSCICTPASSNCNLEDEIQNVTFAGINNNSSCSTAGYGDYRSSVAAAQVSTGISYPIAVTVGDGGGEAIAVWIDYNQDGVFDISEYTYIGYVSGATATANINIPTSALAGTTIMRVRSFYLASGDPTTIYETTTNSSCSSTISSYGETEDYTIEITPGVDCSGIPSIGTISSSATLVCTNEPFTLNTNTNNASIGITYQWQSSVNGGSAWSNIGTAASTTSYTVASQSVETMYRLIATCTITSDADTSTSLTVQQKVASDCYCTNQIAMNCDDGDVITNVTFAGINNNSACGDVTTGYSDYRTSVAAAQITAGTTVPISVTVGPSGGGWLYESVGLWIDYNQDGIMDSLQGEYTNVGTGIDETLTINVNIPANALPGTTRMRVVVTASRVGLDIYSCGPLDPNENYGEMEDYSVNINLPIDSVVVTTQNNVAAQITTNAGTLQLQAAVYQLANNQNVTWSLIPVSGNGAISATGLVTAQTNGTVWGKAVSVADPTKADSILITISNQFNPNVIDSIDVTTLGNVAAQITTNAGTLQLRATIYPIAANQNVTWSLNPVSGNATISTSGLVTAQANGTVWAKAISVADANKADSILITITNQVLGIESLNAFDFKLFPNPSTGVFNLNSTENHGTMELSVMDLTGKIIYSEQIFDNALKTGHQLDLKDVSAGVYLLKLSGNATTIQRQLIKK